MKKFITSLQLEKRNIFILIVIISIFSIIGGIIFYQAELKSIKKDKHEEIRAIANLKSNQISNWYKDHHDDADVIAKSEMLLTFTKNYLKNESKADSENIYKYVIRRQIEHEYQAVILTNTYGDVIVSTDQNIAEIDSITKYFINEVINNKKVISTDLYRCKLHDELQIDFIAPIMENNSVLATIIFRVKPEDFLYPLITSWPTASNTSETLLLRKEGENVVFLNELRHQKNTSLKLNYSLKDTLVPAVQVVLGRKGIFEGLDYRGVDVLAYLTSIPNTPWFMVAKVDKSEIYSELNFRAIVIALFILFLIAITSIGLFWFYHYKQRNLYRELHSTQEEFKTTLYSIGDAVITTDKKGRVKHLNPVAEALTGWKEKDAVDWKLEKVFNIINEETRKQVESPVQKVLREGLVVGLANHTILISKDKREIPIADSGAPIKNEKGEIIGVVLVFRDQTDERMNQKLIYTRIKLNEYSYNHTLEELLTKTLDEVEYITKSKIGFYHFVEDDQETLSLQAWSTRTQKEFCKAEGKGLHYNVNEAGVWIDAIHQKKAVIHNDYKLLSHKKGMPEGHAEVIRELVVPIIRNNKIVAILGVGNKETDYNDKDIEIVSFLADVAWEIVTKKRMDLQILESKNYLNDLIDSAPFGSHNYELDKNGKLIFIGANKAANEILKIEHAQFVGKTIEEVFPSLAETEIPNAYKNVIQTGKKYNLEQIAYDDNKNIHGVFEVHGVKVAENRMTVFFRDITEKKKADEVIRLASLRWETTFNTISNPVALLGEDGTILQCNDAFIKFAKKDLNEIINQKCHTIIHLQNEHIENCPFIRSQSTLKREEMELEVDQKIFNVAIDPIMNSNGKFAGAVHIMEDITEIKQKEKEIFHLNRLYAMLSQTNQAIVRLNNSEDLFKEICKDAVEYGKFNLAWIGLFDVMKNKIVPKTYFGNEDGFITYELSKAPEEQLKLMPCFRAFYEKQTVVKNNVELDPDCEYWRPSALKRGFKSLAATPIYLNGKSTGVFVLYSSEPNFFGEKEIELLKEVGIDISFALDNYAKEELRKATEKMLEINESRFRIISEKTGTIIYDRNLITGKVHREGAIEEILGYSRAEYCNFSVEQYNSLLHEDERDSIIRKEDDLIKSGNNFTRTYRLKHKNGNFIFIEDNGITQRDENGIAIRLLGSMKNITERKLAEQKLIQSEKKYLDLYENAPDMYLSVDSKTAQIIQCNNTLAKLTGYTKEELLGKSVMDLYHPRCHEDFKINLENFRNTGKIIKPEMEVVKKDGSTIIVLLNSTPIFDNDGNIIASRSNWRDITIRKKLESEEKRLWKIVKESLNEIYIFDKETLKFEFANEGALKNLGYSLEEIMHLTPLDLKPEFTESSFKEMILPLKHHEKDMLVFETKHKRKDGSLYDVDVHLQLIPYGKEEVFVTIIQDITERKKADQILKISEERYRSIYENAIVGIYRTSPDGKILLANPTLLKMLGYNSFEELSNRNLNQEGFEPDYPRTDFESLIRTKGFVENLESKWQRKDGSYIYVIESAKLIKDQNGKPIFYEGIVIDITDKKNEETKSHEYEEKIKSIFKVAPVGIGLVKDRVILEVNPRICDMTGYSEDELKGRNARILYPTEDEYQFVGKEKYRQIEEKGKGSVETIWKRKDGTLINVLLSSTPIDIADLDKGVTFTALDITERKKYEEEIKISKERLSATLENTPNVAIQWYDIDGKVLHWNKASESIYGWKSEEVIGKTLDQLILSPEDTLEFKKMLRTIKETNNPIGPNEFTFTRKDGMQGICLSTTFAIPERSGKINFVCMDVDVTERKRAEYELSESENRHKLISQLISDYAYSYDLTSDGKSKLEWVIGAFEQITGFSVEESEERGGWSKLIYEEDFEITKKRTQKLLSGAIDISEFRIVTKDGNIKWIKDYGYPVWDENEKRVTKIYGAAKDITESKTTEIIIAESEAKLRSLIDTSIEGICTVDENEIITFVNPRMALMLNYTVDELINTSFTLLLIPEDLDNHLEEKSKRTRGESSIYERILVTKYGDKIWTLISASPILGKDGNYKGSFGMFTDITEQKLANEEIRKLYRGVEQSPASIIITDKLGNIEFANTKFCELTGYSLSEIIGKNPRILSSGEKSKDEYEKLWNTILSGNDWIGEFLNKKKNGELFWEYASISPIKDDRGIITHFIAIKEDITQKKLFEEQLAKSEEQFRATWANSFDGMRLTDKNGIIVEVNEAFCRLVRKPKEELIGRDLDCTYRDSFDNSLDKYKQRFMNGTIKSRIEAELHLWNGENIWVSLSNSIIIIKNEKKYVLSIFRDISVEKRNEIKLQDNERRFRSISQTAGDAIVVANENGLIDYWNESAVRIFGYKVDEILGKPLETIIPERYREDHQSGMIRFKSSRIPNVIGKTVELVGLRKDGSEFPIELSLANWETSRGDYYSAIIRDITERKKQQTELIVAKEKAEESDRLKSEFLAQMSHEVRTPINVISSYNKMIKEEVEGKIDEELFESFDGIESATFRIMRTIDLILNMSELQTGTYEPIIKSFDIKEMIFDKLGKEFIRLASIKKLDITFIYKTENLLITADEYSMVQIFANLLDNAIKYTHKGSVEILVKRNKKKQLEVKVKDTGIGISEEFLPKLFQPFTQEDHGYARAYEGNGLGLALVKRYCDINNAQITVESKKREGTTFTVII